MENGYPDRQDAREVQVIVQDKIGFNSRMVFFVPCQRKVIVLLAEQVVAEAVEQLHMRLVSAVEGQQMVFALLVPPQP